MKWQNRKDRKGERPESWNIKSAHCLQKSMGYSQLSPIFDTLNVDF